MKPRKRARCLNPADIVVLQECFDALLERKGVSRDSQEAETMAAALFGAYTRGITDRDELIRLADIGPNFAA